MDCILLEIFSKNQIFIKLTFKIPKKMIMTDSLSFFLGILKITKSTKIIFIV